MRPAPFRPSSAHLFVCVNRRGSDDPLGPGCAGQGDALYAALKQAATRAGQASRIWITRTYCQGVCPRDGSSVTLSPGGALFADATVADVPALLALAAGAR